MMHRMTRNIFKKILLGVCASLMLLGPVSLGFIGQNNSISLESQYVHAQEPAPLEGFDANSASLSEYGISCGGFRSVACGIGQIFIVGVFYGGTAFVARNIAGLFDFFLWYTMQASTYVGADYVENAWGIMRDFSNIIFLLALIYAGISIMFQSFNIGSLGNGKKVLAHVIVSAVLVNFSFFFTGALIDASHILSRAFYNKIEADACSDANATNNVFCQDQLGVDYTQFSAGVMARMNPQAIITSSQVLESNTADDPALVNLFFIIYFLGGVLNIVLIGVFFSIFFLMLGRTVSLIFSLIISPLAVATVAIPQIRKQKFIGFDNWISNLMKDAFMLPIFMFFLYMIVIFMSPDFIGGLKEAGLGDDGFDGASMGQRMIQILIPVAFIMVMLLAAKKTAQMLAGDITNIVSSSVKNVTNKTLGTAGRFAGGLAGGLALKGIALGSNKIAGSVANRFGRSAGRNLQSDSAFQRGVGRLQARAQRGIQNTSFDLRRTRAGAALQSATGLNFGTAIGTVNQRNERRQERARQNAELVRREQERQVAEDRATVNQAETTISQLQQDPALANAVQEEAQAVRDLQAQVGEERDAIRTLTDELEVIRQTNPGGANSDEYRAAKEELANRRNQLRAREEELTTRRTRLNNGEFLADNDNFTMNQADAGVAVAPVTAGNAFSTNAMNLGDINAVDSIARRSRILAQGNITEAQLQELVDYGRFRELDAMYNAGQPMTAAQNAEYVTFAAANVDDYLAENSTATEGFRDRYRQFGEIAASLDRDLRGDVQQNDNRRRHMGYDATESLFANTIQNHQDIQERSAEIRENYIQQVETTGSTRQQIWAATQRRNTAQSNIDDNQFNESRAVRQFYENTMADMSGAFSNLGDIIVASITGAVGAGIGALDGGLISGAVAGSGLGNYLTDPNGFWARTGVQFGTGAAGSAAGVMIPGGGILAGGLGGFAAGLEMTQQERQDQIDALRSQMRQTLRGTPNA